MLDLAPGAWALVTGASSGIGEAIAERLAARRIPLVVTARSAGRLEELAAGWRQRFGAPVEVVALDLSAHGSATALFEATEGAGRTVDLLVNNAGFGLNGAETDLPLGRTTEMLQLNVVTLHQATHLFLKAMQGRRRGWILNVASTAAFVPGPYFAAYSATKAFVLSFSQALHEEARPTGVVVTCLCPGFTRTNFGAAAGMKGGEATPFPVLPAGAVADAGLAGLARGRAVVFPHPLDRLWIASLRLAPRSLPPRLAGFFFRRSQLRGDR